jgi:hypothetical protein
MVYTVRLKHIINQNQFSVECMHIVISIYSIVVAKSACCPCQCLLVHFTRAKYKVAAKMILKSLYHYMSSAVYIEYAVTYVGVATNYSILE